MICRPVWGTISKLKSQTQNHGRNPPTGGESSSLIDFIPLPSFLSLILGFWDLNFEVMVVAKRPLPIIGKLSELLSSGGNLLDSPRSPLDFRIQSPRGVRKYDLGGVGLGIVAALEKSGDHGGRLAVRGSFMRKPSGGHGGYENWDPETSDDEDYTVVTCHGPEKSVTKVYYAGCEQRRSNCSGPAKEPSKWFVEEDCPVYPISDFLSSCHLCQKNLHGKDIYMYRGEGFCSPECRSSQIMMDERKERQCRAEATISEKVPSSGRNAGQIFSNGILAI